MVYFRTIRGFREYLKKTDVSTGMLALFDEYRGNTPCELVDGDKLTADPYTIIISDGSDVFWFRLKYEIADGEAFVDDDGYFDMNVGGGKNEIELPGHIYDWLRTTHEKLFGREI